MKNLKLYYKQKIDYYKHKLADSDYKAIKYAEKLISATDYAPIKAERQALRDKIHELENKIAELEQSGESN